MHNRKVAVIGLGYVGLPVAVAFSDKGKTIGFDVSQERIDELKKGFDKTGEVDSKELKKENAVFTSDKKTLKQADFYIVAVPTPIDEAKKPDLSLLENASTCIGSVLKPGDIVVYESTVYPGVTEEVCLPLLEQVSGLKGGKDFFVGYSPERINPGDKLHSFTKIKKIVAGDTAKSLEIVSSVYSSVVEAGVYEASSIKVAEAAKVIENTQRDINIAFVNELSLIFGELGISTHEVLEAANTKWNFLPFKPGLVGGHCIGVDPYYLTYLAESIGHHPDVILSGRRINDRMGKCIAERTVKAIIKEGMPIQRASVAILGFTFKENCPDVRNTKVYDIVSELDTYQINSLVYDPIANKSDVLREYGLELSELTALSDVKVAVVAVAHDVFLDKKMIDYLNQLDLIIDIKNALSDHVKTKKITI